MTEHEEKIIKDTLANVKLRFNRDGDSISLTVQSGFYAIKVDVTDEIISLVNELSVDKQEK
jgi:hypothetical protein